MSNIFIVAYPERAEYWRRPAQWLNSWATDRPTMTIQGAEPNFIGLYMAYLYPKVFPYLSANTDIAPPIVEANPHFIGKYHVGF